MASIRFNRRSFLQTSLAGSGGAVALRGEGAAADSGGATFAEPTRPLPLVEDADVIVCGGGPAGVAAALAAARSGARTRLFEVHGCLGASGPQGC